MNRPHHYHIFVRLGKYVDSEVIHEEKHNTKREAAKAITKLKRGYEMVEDQNGNLVVDTLRWEGEAKWGYVESQEDGTVIYGQKHTDQCVQIDDSCLHQEHGVDIMGWD